MKNVLHLKIPLIGETRDTMLQTRSSIVSIKVRTSPNRNPSLDQFTMWRVNTGGSTQLRLWLFWGSITCTNDFTARESRPNPCCNNRQEVGVICLSRHLFGIENKQTRTQYTSLGSSETTGIHSLHHHQQKLAGYGWSGIFDRSPVLCHRHQKTLAYRWRFYLRHGGAGDTRADLLSMQRC